MPAIARPISRRVTGPAIRLASLTNPPAACSWRSHQMFHARSEITEKVWPW